MGKYYVYELIDPRNMKTFYVGKGTGDRMYVHVDGACKNINNHVMNKKFNKIFSILNDGYSILYDVVYTTDDEEAAYDYERDLIKFYGLNNLTNICSDNRPPNLKGVPKSEKTKLRMKASFTKERRKKISARLIGRKHTKKSKKKMSIKRQARDPEKYNKSPYQWWCERYGIEEADRLQQEFNEKLSNVKHTEEWHQNIVSSRKESNEQWHSEEAIENIRKGVSDAWKDPAKRKIFMDGLAKRDSKGDKNANCKLKTQDIIYIMYLFDEYPEEFSGIEGAFLISKIYGVNYRTLRGRLKKYDIDWYKSHFVARLSC